MNRLSVSRLSVSRPGPRNSLLLKKTFLRKWRENGGENKVHNGVGVEVKVILVEIE